MTLTANRSTSPIAATRTRPNAPTLPHYERCLPLTNQRRARLGHGGEALVKRVYGHLGEVRHSSEVIEYRVKQHRKKLLEKLRHLRIA